LVEAEKKQKCSDPKFKRGVGEVREERNDTKNNQMESKKKCAKE